MIINLKYRKIILATALIFSFIFSSVGPITVSAATVTPDLGDATSYAILGGTYTNTSAATTVTGDIGYTTGPTQDPLGVHTNYVGAPTPNARIDAASALSTGLATQPCTFTFVSPIVNLSTDVSHPTGVYTPGVYCSTGAMSIGTAGITLNGAGTYIFRADGALTTADSSEVTLSGASACDVFWTPTAATTLGATTKFFGTIIDNAHAITVGANTTWGGRALSLGAGTVTTGSTSTITAPTCTAPPASSYINVVKVVVNDDSRSKVIADFPLFVNGVAVTSGATNLFSSGTYTITETKDANYTQIFSGDCPGGIVSLNPGDTKFCIITNDDIPVESENRCCGGSTFVPPVPPIISVLKVPSPLALPNGSGPVTYTYTLYNIGTVPVNNVTMVDDTCSPMIFVFGDTNSDSKLDVNETWTYDCFKTLSETHTNTVVATGWANGISTTDIASATVVVGVPIVPPLIHVTKVPSPLTLPARGGIVTYTKKITNPGTVALSNVYLTDDKCNPVNYVFGDTNGDSKLDTTETWTYTCSANLTKTTTNTVVATGQANGLTARDFAIATVVVAAPALPNTGFPPEEKNPLWIIVAMVGVLMLVLSSFVLILKKRTA